MNNSIYRFPLDLHKHQSQVSISAFQHDTATRLYISLTDGGVPYLIDHNCAVHLYAQQANGTPLIHPCMIIDDSRVIYDFKDSTTEKTGIVNCQLRIYGIDGALISAPRFTIVVEERVVQDYDVHLSEDQLLSIDEMLSKEIDRQEAEKDREDAEKKREDAETARDGRISAIESDVNTNKSDIAAIQDDLFYKDYVPRAEAFCLPNKNAGTWLVPVFTGYEQVNLEITSKADDGDANDHYVFVVRTNNANINLPNQLANGLEPELDQSISKRWANDKYAKKSEVSSVYRPAGSYDNWVQLNDDITFYQSYTPQNGDVVNIIEADTANDGNAYPAGTNFVYIDGHWDALGGIGDMSRFVTKYEDGFYNETGRVYGVNNDGNETTYQLRDTAQTEDTLLGAIPTYSAQSRSFNVLYDTNEDNELVDYEPREYDAVNRHWTEKYVSGIVGDLSTILTALNEGGIV